MTAPHDPSLDTESQSEASGKWFSNCAICKNAGNKQVHEERQHEAAEYGDSSASYWELYTSEAEISDHKFVETLTTDTTAISILNGIFSAIIASFIVQTTQSLQPNNSQATVCLLSRLAFPDNSTQQSPFCPGPYPGEPSPAIIRSNILLLISFFLAIMSVLACGLIQQWCHEFMKYAYPRAAPHKRGRVRTYLYQGLNRFYIKRFLYGVHFILHISVFLFLCGFSDYLHDTSPRVGMVSWYCVFSLMALFATLSLFPLFIGNCPYQTALTPPLLFGSTLLLFFCRTAWLKLCHGQRVLPRKEERHFDKSRYLVEKANANASRLDPYAMKWLFTDDDFTDTDMDKFLEGLPGYFNSHFTVTSELLEVLTAPYVLQRIREHLLTCITTAGLSEQARIKRVSTCVDSLRVIIRLRTKAKNFKNSDDESLRAYFQSIVGGLNSLCDDKPDKIKYAPDKIKDVPDKIRDLRAFCVRALTFQGILTKCLEPATAAESPIKALILGYFRPLYTCISSNIEIKQKEPNEDEDTQWRVLLNDGPFINLTLLARAILSHGELDVDPAILSMCWKTLDILRSSLQITRADISASSLEHFDDIRTKTRTRVESEDLGFSVVPLREALEAVDGGRRLSMVFQDHSKYRDLVFGKGHLRNPDLFRAFASCLPHFVENNPDKSKVFMEGLVRRDHLWISLQDHLLNSLQPNCLVQDMIRTFDTCCTVIDTAFVALEGSQNVDWRAPDFGSLAHYFELFVTDCFRGMFIGRAIGFRVGLIKARFCNAVLALFLAEFQRKHTVVFRSHWDVASLARVFYSLGVGDEAGVEYWKSFVDGGPIGEVLMNNTYVALELAKRDGPLLNFCKLVRLGIMSVPFEWSGLTEADFDKLLNLMQKMAKDSRLRLVHDSTPVTVWEELGQLRDEVVKIRNANQRVGHKDGKHMEDLLVKIEEVICRPPSTASPEHCSNDHVQSQASETLAVVQPNPPSGGLPLSVIPSHATTSTTVMEDQYNISPIQEDDSEDVTSAQFSNSRGEFPDMYINPYPHLPGQVDHKATITTFLPRPSPHLGSTDVASPGVSSTHPTLPYLRLNSQRRQSSIYYAPKVDATTD